MDYFKKIFFIKIYNILIIKLNKALFNSKDFFIQKMFFIKNVFNIFLKGFSDELYAGRWYEVN